MRDEDEDEVSEEEREQARQELAAALAAERDAQWNTRLAEERARTEHAVRDECEARLQESLEIERSAVAMACASFGKARERYFADIEREVVRLALTIATRVLHREVAMDPAALAGVVRVALSKLGDADGIGLFVPPNAAEVWSRAMKSDGLRVEADASLAKGEVQLRSTASVAELGIEAQLVEIERGFFDLLSRRPA